MRRFCVTPRTNRPSRVLPISSATPSSTSAANTRMASRLYGSVRLGSTCTPPDSQTGSPRHVLRAEDRAHQLHQDQADAPGGQQVSSGRPYSQRITLRSSTAPTSAAGQEAGRDGRHDVEVEGTRQVLPEQVLHQVGGIGADHHQLAVRHVDDAHQPVGDGQAQRHQQQDRAQADAGEQHAQPLAPGQARLHGVQRRSARRAPRHRPRRSAPAARAAASAWPAGCCRPAASRRPAAWPCRGWRSAPRRAAPRSAAFSSASVSAFSALSSSTSLLSSTWSFSSAIALARWLRSEEKSRTRPAPLRARAACGCC
jgi:hypothetical protein